jgi:predicted ester cyclase
VRALSIFATGDLPRPVPVSGFAGVHRVVSEQALVTTGTQHGPLGELPAPGNRVDFTALQLFRVEDELIVEHWEIFDETTLTQQLTV